MEKSNSIDVAVIGAGPAGITAALYAKRKALNVRIFESEAIGGQTADAIWVENYPGVKKIEGFRLMKMMSEHLAEFGVEVEEAAEITSAKKTEQGFELDINDGEEKVLAKTLVLCTGNKYKALGIPGEKEFYGKGLSYCATCDGPAYKDKTVAIVGAGNSGANAALFFADISKKVYLIEFNEKTAFDQVYGKKLEEAKVKIKLNTQVTEITGEGKATGIKTKNRATNKEEEIRVNGIFVYIGTVPKNKIAKDLGLKLNERGYIDVDKSNATSLEGVLAAGDITGELAQTVVAAGSGAIAATTAFELIKGLK